MKRAHLNGFLSFCWSTSNKSYSYEEHYFKIHAVQNCGDLIYMSVSICKYEYTAVRVVGAVFVHMS